METQKYCSGCNKNLPLELFTKNISRKDGLQRCCRECMKAYRIKHYQANKEQHYARNNKTQYKLRELVLERKNVPCTNCGISYPGEPWLMEFDHRDPSAKSGNISIMAQKGNKSSLLEELSKCDLVCVVCHRRRSAKRGNWVLNRMSHAIEYG